MVSDALGMLALSALPSEVEAIRRGLPVEAALRLAQTLSLSEPELAQLLGISGRTLARHKLSQRPLQPTVSDRLYRLARIAALATEVLEDGAVARDWLRRPNRALAGSRPLDLLDTDAGAEQVSQVLNRIEYGVYS